MNIVTNYVINIGIRELVFREKKVLDFIWVFLLITGILIGIATGNADQIGNALINSAGEAVSFCIGILGAVALWCGLMNILNEAGFIRFTAKLLRPVIRKLFPETAQDEEAERHILTNFTANFMGLGNGATPSGIMAVSALQRHAGENSPVASRSVCLFLVINSAAFQLIPTTIIAMRAQAGSASPAGVILPVWIVSIISLICAVLAFFVYERISGLRKGRSAS